MTKFGPSDEEASVCHAQLFETLEDSEDYDFSLIDVMGFIQEYLVSSYFLSINPLPQLRHILPQFTWRFVRCKGEKEACRLVSTSDLIWMSNWKWHSSDEIDLVVASSTKKGRRLFFAGEKNASEPTTEWIEFAKRCGAEPAYSEITNL